MPDSVETLRAEVTRVTAAAQQYFDDSDARLGTPAEEKTWLPESPDIYLSVLPADLQHRSGALVKELLAAISALSPLFQTSSLVTEADRRDLSTMTKTRLAMRMRLGAA